MASQDTSGRDKAIRELADMGASYALIGVAAGISRQRVQQIVNTSGDGKLVLIRTSMLEAYKRVSEEAYEQPRPTASLKEALEALELVKLRRGS